ncbi:MAG: ABC transporter permease subunit [Armatimonadota bacterium]|nr:ABC transporter permease subunit [Armatimonadota bacterium]
MSRPVRRLLAVALVTVWGASTVAFGFMHLAPMDPARFMVGFRQGVRDGQITRLREWYGLDDPIPLQYLRWMGRALRGDFGASVATRREVGPEIWRRVPWSLLLAGTGAVVAWVLAVGLSVASAGGGILGAVGDGLIALGLMAPGFLVATAFVYVFAVRLTLIPILPPFELNPLDPALWLGLVLPTASLALPLAAAVAVQLRRDLTAALSARFAVSARARGLAPGRVVWGHAARVVTRRLLARPLPWLSLLLSGLLLIEEIFNWPGIGRSFTRAVTQRDIPVMQATLLVLAIVAVAGEVLLRRLVGRIGLDAEAYAASAPGAAPVGRPSPLPATDWRLSVATAVAALLVIGAVAAPLVARFPPDQVLLDEINMAPSRRHWMGTDSSGRDLFSRLLHASRTTLGIAVLAAAVSVTSTVVLAATTRGRPAWPAFTVGLGRTVLAMPPLGLALAIIATAGRSPAVIAATFVALGYASIAAQMRALQADAWRWPFVEAARAAGASPLWIGERHLLPHLARPLVAAAAGLVPGFVLLEATLGFLGFSVAPTTPSWGTMLWRAREALHRGDWWLIVFPVLFVAAATWAFAALSETLGRTPPPSFVRPARLRLGREWGQIPTPALRPVQRPAPAKPAASASMEGAGGGDGSGAAS